MFYKPRQGFLRWWQGQYRQRRIGKEVQRPSTDAVSPHLIQNGAWQKLTTRPMTPALWSLPRMLEGMSKRVSGCGHRQLQSLPHWFGQIGKTASGQQRRLAWGGHHVQKTEELLPTPLRTAPRQHPHITFARAIQERYLVHRGQKHGGLEFYRQQPEPISSGMSSIGPVFDAGLQVPAAPNSAPPVLLRHTDHTVTAEIRPPTATGTKTGRRLSKLAVSAVPAAVTRLFSRSKSTKHKPALQLKGLKAELLTRQFPNSGLSDSQASAAKEAIIVDPPGWKSRWETMLWRGKAHAGSPAHAVEAKIVRGETPRPYSDDQEAAAGPSTADKRQSEALGRTQMPLPDNDVPIQSNEAPQSRRNTQLLPRLLLFRKQPDEQATLKPYHVERRSNRIQHDVTGSTSNRQRQQITMRQRLALLSFFRKPSSPPQASQRPAVSEEPETAVRLQGEMKQRAVVSASNQPPLTARPRRERLLGRVLPSAAVHTGPETTDGSGRLQSRDSRRGSGTANSHQPARIQRAAGSTRGRPLPLTIRARIGRMLGIALPDATLHTGPEATAVTEHLQADAATVGRQIYIKPEHARFDTPRGLALLGHELIHVAQGAWRGPPSTLQLQADERQALAAERLILTRTTAEQQSAPPFFQKRLPLRKNASSQVGQSGPGRDVTGRSAAVTHLGRHGEPLFTHEAPLRMAQRREVAAINSSSTASTMTAGNGADIEQSETEQAPDVDELAEEVIRRLRYRLNLEKELRGV